MSKRKGSTKHFEAAAYHLMRRYDWTPEDFAEYVQGPTFKTLREKASAAQIRSAEIKARAEKMRIKQPDPLQAGTVWIAHSLWTAGICEILEGEVIVGPKGGRTIKYREPWFNGKGSTEYNKRPNRYGSGWQIGAGPIFTDRAGAEAHLKGIAERYVTPDDLPNDTKALRRIARDNHPDRNASGDVELYQRAIVKLKCQRGVSA